MEGLENIAVPSKFENLGGHLVQLLRNELSCLDPKSRKTTIHDYQMKAALSTLNHFESGNRTPALIVAPTGSGKSGIVTMLPYVLKSKKAIIISPSKIISRQLGSTFGLGAINNEDGRLTSFFVKTKICPVDKFHDCAELPQLISNSTEINDMDWPNLVIVNAQKFGGNSNMRLMERDGGEITEVNKKFGKFTTVIVDEAHHYPAETWRQIVSNFVDKQIVFLTATPYRSVNGNLEPILGDNQTETYRIKKVDVEGVSIRKSAYQLIDTLNVENYLEFETRTSDAEECRDVENVIHLILNYHDRLNPNVMHKAMVLVREKAEAEELAGNMGEATYVTSEQKTERHLKAFEDGQYRILVVCGKLLEGYDNSDVSVCVILRKVQSLLLFTQFVGRCLRLSHPGDTVTATILSLDDYDQQKMWEQFEKPTLAESDPVDLEPID